MNGQIDMFGSTKKEPVPEEERFRKECEEYLVSAGTGFINGKYRIKTHHKEMTLTEDVLKNEYGNGGWSVTWSDGTKGRADHDARGVEYSKRAAGGARIITVRFKWSEALALIDKAISEGIYKIDQINKPKELLDKK